jgi:hypothetical protein
MAASAGLSDTQFSTFNSAGINDPERQEKYNNTSEVRGNFLQSHCNLDRGSKVMELVYHK